MAAQCENVNSKKFVRTIEMILDAPFVLSAAGRAHPSNTLLARAEGGTFGVWSDGGLLTGLMPGTSQSECTIHMTGSARASSVIQVEVSYCNVVIALAS